MLFLLGSVLYRAGAGWHGNAIKQTAFRRAGPNFERPLLRAICFFCSVLKKGYSIPPALRYKNLGRLTKPTSPYSYEIAAKAL